MDTINSVSILGAGGHAKVVISTFEAAGWAVSAVFDDDPDKLGTHLLGCRVVGPVSEFIHALHGLAVIAVGDNPTRKTIADRSEDVEWASVVHPGATVHPSASLGAGTVVFAGAVIQPDAIVGAHCIINTGATIDHDCTIGDFVHVAPGCHLAGGVCIEDGVLVGIGSALIPGVRIGRWTTVGCGSAVTCDIPADVVAAGVPARVLKAGKTR